MKIGLQSTVIQITLLQATANLLSSWNTKIQRLTVIKKKISNYKGMMAS